MLGLVLCIALFVFLNLTKRGKLFTSRLRHRLVLWKYNKWYPWLKRNKNSRFLKYLENASWFKWYGKKVVYVKPKDPSQLTSTEKDVKDAINAKDYKKALEIVLSLPVTAKTTALRQVIEAKLQVPTAK